jgi:hypothetical protein
VSIIEYTAGWRQKLWELIDKAAGGTTKNTRKTRPKPPYHEQLRYGVRFKGQSNLQDTQEL